MSLVTDEHIDYIAKDLSYRGIVHEELQSEFIDHIASAVEVEMEKGTRFLEAYHSALKKFGHTSGLRKTQHQTLAFENSKTKIMLKNYFLIAIRNLRKHSFYSAINIIGLSIGIGICLIISLFVLNELKYDQHHEHADRIYRIHADIKFGGNHWDMVQAPAPMAATLAAELPEVEAAIRFRGRGSYLIKRETENIKENKAVWVDKDFFKIFTVPVLSGNPDIALAEPNSIAISKSLADKFFKNEDAVGQTLILDNNQNVKVTAVFEDMPSTSHFHFNMLIAMAGMEEANSPSWLSNNFNTYILLREGTDPATINLKLNKLIETHMMPQIVQFLEDFSEEKFVAAGNKMSYSVQPLTDVHLKSSLLGEFEPNFDITYLYLFVSIALFILVIASINFMNLSTARSSNRAKEVGVRKVMGSLRGHLMRQFLTESVLLSALSFIFAVGIAYLLLPIFNSLSQRELTIPFTSPTFYTVLFAGALFIGILAGIYPSFFLSAFKPVNVLKGNVALGMKSGVVRSSLVVFQFMISIFLVVGTVAVYMQLDYIQNKKIGFNKNQVIEVEDAYALGDQRVAFKNELLKNSFIESATITGYLPVSGGWRSDTPWWVEGKDAVQENMVSLQNWHGDHDYIKTLGMSIKYGRDFSKEFPSDSTAVILNEAAAQAFFLGEDPLEKYITSFGETPEGEIDKENLERLKVIGVVEDFHFESMKENISPVMIFLSEQPSGGVLFRFQAGSTQDVIAAVESTWKEMAPGQPFSYSFLDESFGRMYASETRLGTIFGIFAVIAIVIACLGLFALTAFTAEQRTKEIGIRKVLGASVSGIVLMLSKDFGKLVLIAFALAIPFAWWGIHKWLEAYQYKVEIGWWVYALSGVAAFLVAWLTMSYQSIRAAISNPVNSLRSE